MKLYYAKFIDTFGMVAYLGPQMNPVYKIEQAMTFEEKDHAKAWLAILPAHKRHGKFQKIGHFEMVKEDSKAFEIAV